MTAANDLAVRRALEAAGVEFIDGNRGGPGVPPAEGASIWKAQIRIRHFPTPLEAAGMEFTEVNSDSCWITNWGCGDVCRSRREAVCSA
jgi:hypothetical protein